MDKSLKLAAICMIVLGMTITVSVSSYASAQTTGDTESSRQWCVKKKDELKDRMTDLLLLVFTPGSTYNMTIDIKDRGTVLVAETEQKMVDCVDYLTGSEMQTLQGIREAAVFSAITADTVFKIFSDPGASPEDMSRKAQTLFFDCMWG